MTYIEELKDAIRSLHGVESHNVESVPVKETFQGKAVWEGMAGVFELHRHPQATRVNDWAHDVDNPEHPRRHITVLHIVPVVSAANAVRATMIQEFRANEPEEA